MSTATRYYFNIFPHYTKKKNNKYITQFNNEFKNTMSNFSLTLSWLPWRSRQISSASTITGSCRRRQRRHADGNRMLPAFVLREIKGSLKISGIKF